VAESGFNVDDQVMDQATVPREEELRERWIDTADDAEQRRLATQIQEIALTDVLYVPLGRGGPTLGASCERQRQ
jgi:hypothetical protein